MAAAPVLVVTVVGIKIEKQGECLQHAFHSFASRKNIVGMIVLGLYSGITGHNHHTAFGGADEDGVIPGFMTVMGGLPMVSNCNKVHFFRLHGICPHIQGQFAVALFTGLGMDMGIAMVSNTTLIQLIKGSSLFGRCRNILGNNGGFCGGRGGFLLGRCSLATAKQHQKHGQYCR